VKRPVRFAVFLVAGLALAAALAFFVSPQASGEPDGLNRVAIDEGFAETDTDHALTETPTAGYSVEGVDDERLSTGLAGIIGVAVTFAVAGGLMLVVRRTGARSAGDAASPSSAVPG
jgi:cobalt/nickel transport protein